MKLSTGLLWVWGGVLPSAQCQSWATAVSQCCGCTIDVSPA